MSRARAAVVAALLDLVGGDRARAADALLLPAGIADQAIATNSDVRGCRTTPALRRYAGTVYDGLAFAGLSAAEQRIAGRSTLIFSGLLGVVRGDEPVPDYRVPAKAVLPGIGVASTYWRPVLEDVVPGLVRRGLVVDLRSSDYAAMWRPDRTVAARVVPVRVLSPAPRGGHAVISYNSKFAKGRLTAALVRRIAAGATVENVADIAAAWADCGGVDCVEGARGGLELYTA